MCVLRHRETQAINVMFTCAHYLRHIEFQKVNSEVLSPDLVRAVSCYVSFPTTMSSQSVTLDLYLPAE